MSTQSGAQALERKEALFYHHNEAFDYTLLAFEAVAGVSLTGSRDSSSRQGVSGHERTSVQKM
jgi:hypothetical protein